MEITWEQYQAWEEAVRAQQRGAAAAPAARTNENQYGPQPFRNVGDTFYYNDRHDPAPALGPGGPPRAAGPQVDYGGVYTASHWMRPYAYTCYPQTPYPCPYPYPVYQPGGYYPTAPPASPKPPPQYYYPYPTGWTAAPAPAPAPAANKKHEWYGRTQAEVHRDTVNSMYQQANPGVAPADPRPDDDFWVYEKDGQYIIKNHATIMHDHKPGHWSYSNHHGRQQFIWVKE